MALRRYWTVFIMSTDISPHCIPEKKNLMHLSTALRKDRLSLLPWGPVMMTGRWRKWQRPWAGPPIMTILPGEVSITEIYGIVTNSSFCRKTAPVTGSTLIRLLTGGPAAGIITMKITAGPICGKFNSTYPTLSV